MEFHIVKTPHLPYFCVTLTGRFSLQVLEECYREIFNNPEWKPDTDILWDVRQSTFEHLTTADLNAIGAMTLLYREQRGKGTAAWVVGREIDYGISRMFEMLLEGKVGFGFRVFKSMKEAEDFLDKPAEIGR